LQCGEPQFIHTGAEKGLVGTCNELGNRGASPQTLNHAEDKEELQTEAMGHKSSTGEEKGLNGEGTKWSMQGDEVIAGASSSSPSINLGGGETW